MDLFGKETENYLRIFSIADGLFFLFVWVIPFAMHHPHGDIDLNKEPAGSTEIESFEDTGMYSRRDEWEKMNEKKKADTAFNIMNESQRTRGESRNRIGRDRRVECSAKWTVSKQTDGKICKGKVVCVNSQAHQKLNWK